MRPNRISRHCKRCIRVALKSLNQRAKSPTTSSRRSHRLFLKLYISGAKEIDIHGKRAIIIFVPVPQLRAYQKIQIRLVRELEKKFSGRHVVFIAQRRILPKPNRKIKNKQKQKRPISRTLTSVHEAILEDLCFPAEIVGKRIRIKADGSKLIKVHLDKNQQTNIEHKLEVFRGVYKRLTGKDVVFEFPDYVL
ncbi:RP-S7e [Acanthosepion pharaonis]|uniref:40S ribosomal protein S7 n=1 Tax=Acanthosepion pharaonis TaxID=158019 RepID=A0A812CCN7_ACAPH|nr:RP-S7e [Sepia pharaonis]